MTEEVVRQKNRQIERDRAVAIVKERRSWWLEADDMFIYITLVAGAWTERQKMYHGGSFLKLADDDMDIQNPEAQNRELGGF